MHFLQNSQRERANIKNLHSHKCINVISSSGRFALSPAFGALEQRGASRKPGIKIIAPALMTCDELEISWIFQPCASSCGADDLFGGSSDIVRYFNLLSFSLLAGGICDNEQCVIFIKGLFNYTSWKGGKLFSHIIHSNCSPIFLGQ